MAAAWANVGPPLFPRCPRLTLRLRPVLGTLFPAAKFDGLGIVFPADVGEVAAEYFCRIVLLNTTDESSVLPLAAAAAAVEAASMSGQVRARGPSSRVTLGYARNLRRTALARSRNTAVVW